MNWIEEVREALKTLIYLHDNPPILGRTRSEEIGFARKALAAIPDEDPMEKLLGWLRDNYNLDNQLVIDYIKKELGYGKENE